MKALLLIDIQNDFLPGGALAVKHGDQVVPVANRLMSQYDLVVATQDFHPANHKSFASEHSGRQVGDVIQRHDHDQILWPAHCVQGTTGAELAAALDRNSIDMVIPKGTDPEIDSYSGFFDNARRKTTGLADYLRRQNVDEVHLAGLATDYCVKHTALDAIDLGFKTVLLAAGVRGVELKRGDCQRAINEMKAAGVEIRDCTDPIGQSMDGETMPESGELTTLYTGRHLSLVARGKWEFVRRTAQKPAVGIVAITDDGLVVLVEQYRVPVGRTVIELPAGLAGDIAGAEDEPLEQAARRELLEETGYIAARWTRLAGGYSSPGLTDESIVLFLAEGLVKQGPGGGDESEQITLHEVPIGEVFEWLADRGAQADLKLLAGLYAANCHRSRREHGANQ